MNQAGRPVIGDQRDQRQLLSEIIDANTFSYRNGTNDGLFGGLQNRTSL